MFDVRRSGVLMHVTSLPSAYGLGDLGSEAFAFVDSLVEAGQSIWQVLPLNPTDAGHGYSPYSSYSAFAGNPMLVSPEKLVAEGFVGSEELPPVPPFKATRQGLEEIERYRKSVLDKAYVRFTAGDLPAEQTRAFEEFRERNGGWVDDFALFCTIKDSIDNHSWIEWKEELRAREPDAITNVRQSFYRVYEKHVFIQFLFYRQWVALKSYANERGVHILGDIPIYVRLDSADTWANPRLFNLDESLRPVTVAGVPPDYFSATGQLWGNPVYRWDVLQEQGFEWWIRRIQQMRLLYDGARIDHFRGLVAFWEVSAREKTAVNGKWSPVPYDAFFTTLQAHTDGFPIVAEDLGLITDDVREVMTQYGFPGMRVLLFAFGEDNPNHIYLPHSYAIDGVAYTGTHDTNTFRGWFEKETGEQERQRLFAYMGRQVSLSELHWEAMRLLMMSVARTTIFPMQDILGLGVDGRMNRPGSAHGNWAWRMGPEQFDSASIDKLRELTRTYGRIPPEVDSGGDDEQ
ncbi:MAG: 4-alpha-glucanotransferase [Chitinivibrionales bacterium]|nr:4-alpha-glucanotransferase [Chitinivibrionales bacterium]